MPAGPRQPGLLPPRGRRLSLGVGPRKPPSRRPPRRALGGVWQSGGAAWPRGARGDAPRGQGPLQLHNCKLERHSPISFAALLLERRAEGAPGALRGRCKARQQRLRRQRLPRSPSLAAALLDAAGLIAGGWPRGPGARARQRRRAGGNVEGRLRSTLPWPTLSHPRGLPLARRQTLPAAAPRHNRSPLACDAGHGSSRAPSKTRERPMQTATPGAVSLGGPPASWSTPRLPAPRPSEWPGGCFCRSKAGRRTLLCKA